MIEITDLTYLKNLDKYLTEKPYFLGAPINKQVPPHLQTNIEYEQLQRVRIEDVRDIGLDEFNFDDHSFRFMKHQSETDMGGRDLPIRAYCNEMSEFVKLLFDAERVICYDFRTRLDQSSPEYTQSADEDRAIPAPPVRAVHVDHTKTGGFHRIRRHLSEQEAEKYLDGRFRARIVNVWRPLYRKVLACPLALCDARSVRSADLVEADRVSEGYAGEVYYVKSNPDQRWYWLSEQTPEEIAVFVSFDSEHHNSAKPFNFCAHTAFDLIHQKQSTIPPRESVEVRFIVLNA